MEAQLLVGSNISDAAGAGLGGSTGEGSAGWPALLAAGEAQLLGSELSCLNLFGAEVRRLLS